MHTHHSVPPPNLPFHPSLPLPMSPPLFLSHFSVLSATLAYASRDPPLSCTRNPTIAHTTSYPLSAYFVAKVLSELPVAVFLPTVFGSIVYPALRLQVCIRVLCAQSAVRDVRQLTVDPGTCVRTDEQDVAALAVECQTLRNIPHHPHLEWYAKCLEMHAIPWQRVTILLINIAPICMCGALPD